MRYIIASTLTLVAVLLGIVVGLLIAPYVEKGALAYPAAVQNAPPAQQPPAPPTTPSASPKIIPANPQLSSGTIAAYLLLSHHLQSDELVVNGYDVLKLQEAEVELLARFIPATEIQKAINSARVGEIYQVAQQPAPAPTPAPAPAK